MKRWCVHMKKMFLLLICSALTLFTASVSTAGEVNISAQECGVCPDDVTPYRFKKMISLAAIRSAVENGVCYLDEYTLIQNDALKENVIISLARGSVHGLVRNFTENPDGSICVRVSGRLNEDDIKRYIQECGGQ